MCACKLTSFGNNNLLQIWNWEDILLQIRVSSNRKLCCKCSYFQWRSQGGAHWGTCPTNLALCPTKILWLLFSKSLKIAILATTLFKQRISYTSYHTRAIHDSTPFGLAFKWQFVWSQISLLYSNCLGYTL